MLGIENGAVLQRGKDGTCDILLCDCKMQPVCNGTAYTERVDDTTYRLRGIPVGGPYTVVIDDKRYKNIYVGDVWLLGGQSNMEGNGAYRDGDKLPVAEDIRARYMTGIWGTAAHPLHTPWKAEHAVHRALIDIALSEDGARHRGVGPALAFAKYMREKTGVPQGVLCCAHGGSTLEQWSAELKASGENSLFGSMILTLRSAGSHIAGLFWSQGCSEGMSGNVALAEQFTAKTTAVFSALREFLGDEIPIVQTQIARLVGGFDPNTVGKTITEVKEQQRIMGEHFPRLLTVPTVHLPLDDIVHLSASAQDDVGRRAAEAMCLLCGDSSYAPPIELEKYEISTDPRYGSAVITVIYRNVSGVLCATGSPSGFAVAPSPGGEGNTVFDTVLCGDSVRLRLGSQPQHLAGNYLCYGAGLQPFCNITDNAGRPLPAMAVRLIGGD